MDFEAILRFNYFWTKMAAVKKKWHVIWRFALIVVALVALKLRRGKGYFHPTAKLRITTLRNQASAWLRSYFGTVPKGLVDIQKLNNPDLRIINPGRKNLSDKIFYAHFVNWILTGYYSGRMVRHHVFRPRCSQLLELDLLCCSHSGKKSVFCINSLPRVLHM